MFYTLTLAAHIIVACATIVALAYAVFALIKAKHEWYPTLMAGIALLALVETASGFLLAVISPTVTFAYVASHLVWYLGLCLVAEALLLMRARRVWIS